MKKLLTGFVAVALAATGIGFALNMTAGTQAGLRRPPQTAPLVEVALVKAGAIRKEVTYVAAVRAEESVTITPKVTGVLRSVNVDLGDRVEEGETIALIDDEEFVQRVTQAEANLELAQARLQQSQIALRLATRERERTKTGNNQGLITEQELDAAVSALESSRANLSLAKAEITRAESQVKEAQINVKYTQIVAPLSGFIDKRRADPGALVSPNSPICTIVRTDPARIIVNIPESEVYLAEIGLSTIVNAPGLQAPIDGRVNRVAPTVDMATGTIQVEISVQNSEGKLRPGLTAEVTFVARERSQTLLIHEESLLRDNDSVDVYRVVDDIARRVPVEIGIIGNKRAEVLAGLEEGDKIVVNGQFLLVDGTKVRPGAPQEDSTTGADAKP
jgi:RND family efflux transporter MFP subunit